ncbi:unnamed protein product [Prorocentrum cordatum]|uniref:Guanine nucleotide-binding protein subunit beta-like protein n=1 Tax=Prorocentrum cordatum TaxID=2364126 RepID=A0ABN9Y1B9_9DINO|nr:unnamed protein product [Polarella glacialis]
MRAVRSSAPRKQALGAQRLFVTLVRVRRQLVLSGRPVWFMLIGAWLFEGSRDHRLILWDLERAECVRELEGHGGAVQCAAVHWGSKRALSGGHDGSLQLWDLESGSALRTYRYSGRSGCGACTADWDVGLWNLHHAVHAVAELRGHEDLVQCVSLHVASLRAASGSDDCTVRIWCLRRGAAQQELRGHRSGVHCLAVDWEADRALSGSHDGSLVLWDLGRGAELRRFQANGGWVRCVSVDWRGLRALSGSEDGKLRLWDLRGGEPAGASQQPQELAGHSGAVQCVCADWDQHRAVSGSDDCSLLVWDLGARRADGLLRGHRSSIRSVAAMWS